MLMNRHKLEVIYRELLASHGPKQLIQKLVNLRARKNWKGYLKTLV